MNKNGYPLAKPPNSMEFHYQPSVDGMKIKKYPLNEQQMDKEDSFCNLKTNQKKKNLKYVTAESLPYIKKETLIDKSNLCNLNTQLTKFGATLDQELIGKDLNLTKFWNIHKRALSKKLWLPTETVFADSLLNYSKMSSNITEPNSWFSIKKMIPTKMNLQKTLCQSSKFISVKKTENADTQKNNQKINQLKLLKEKVITNEDKENLIKKELDKFNSKSIKFPDKQSHYKNLYETNKIKIENLNQTPYVASKMKQLNKTIGKQIKTHKIKLNLNNSQKEIFKQWSGTNRYMYNKMLYLFNQKEEQLNFQNLRNKYTPKERIKDNEKWLLDVPKEIRAHAIKELCDNFSTNMSLYKKNKVNHFTLNYKKKNESQSFTVPHSALKLISGQLSLYKNILKENCVLKTNKREHITNINFDCKIKMISSNVCYIYIPYTFSGVVFNENQVKDVLALDPGIRTFLTGYSPNGHIIEIGKNSIQKIIRLCLLIDKMQSIVAAKGINKIKCRKRLKIIKKINTIRLRIRNLKNDLHNKTANFLCKNYSVILIPKTDLSNMVRKGKRVLNSKSVRALMGLNHYEFRQKLLTKSRDYNSLVLECNEAYTTKTCTNCGCLNETIKGKKIFKCPNKDCNLEIDRDINGSRNILLRNLI